MTRTPRPSFPGGLRAEARKLARMAMVWAMLGLALLLFAVIALALPTAGNLKQQLEQHPSAFLFNLYDVYLNMFDAGSGIFLMVVAARLVGMEYTGGTIRVLLARGAGRLRVLLAKLTVLGLFGLVLLAGFLGLVTAATYATAAGWGDAGRLAAVPAVAWTDLGLEVLVALASMAVAILLGATAAVTGRSLAFGVGAALALFPADNFGTVVLGLLGGLTRQQAWRDASAYLLGPNLNVLPVVLQRDHVAHAAFLTPLVRVDATHAWLVVAAWALALLTLALVLTRRRDVLQ